MNGAPGFTSNLRDYIDLLQESSWRKRVLIEARPTKVVEDWSVYSGDCYVAPVLDTYKGVPLDVVNVSTLLDNGLVRAESAADCVSTAGTFYYDPDEEPPFPPFVWDQTDYDSGYYWDQFVALYIHLEDDVNPSTTKVTAHYAIRFASDGSIHPTFGPEKLEDGGYETWASGEPQGWSLTPSGGSDGDISQIPGRDTGYAALVAQTTAGETVDLVRDSNPAIVAGGMYRVCGYYYTEGSGECTLRVGDGASGVMDSSGRGTGTPPAFSATGGVWRRFVFDFVAQASSATLAFRVSGAANLGLDSISMYRTWRWDYHWPRVDARSAPESSAGSRSIFFAGQTIGVGNVSLVNRDGGLDAVTNQLDWLNREVRTYAGGAFSDGQELPRDDYRTQHTGLIQSMDTDDEVVKLDLQDAQEFFHIELPPRNFDDSVFATVDIDAIGKPRPLLFGRKEGIAPVRVDKTSNAYGIYEIADCTDVPAGIYSIDTVYAYINAEEAKKQTISRRLSLALSTDYSADLANGRITLLRDVGPYEIIDTENKVDFKYDGTTYVATLTKGLYAAAALAAHIQVKLRETIGGGNTTMCCEYDETTHQFIFYDSASTALEILCDSGDNKSAGPWEVIGISGSVDHIGPCNVTSGVDDDIDFNVGGSALLATLDPGTYASAEDLAAEIQSKMRAAASVSDIDVEWSSTSGKLTISKAAGTLELLINSGANKATGAWTLMGFDASASSDLDGALSYDGEKGIFGDDGAASHETPFLDADESHVIRVNAKGYKDDASGTYTGVPGGLVEVGVDIAAFVVSNFIGNPLSVMDPTSWENARARAPESLAIYLDEQISTRDLFETLEASNIATIARDGSGKLFYDVYVGTVPSSTPVLRDHDYHTFSVETGVSEVYKTTRVEYDQNPETRTWASRETTDDTAEARYGRTETKKIKTYLKIGDNAQAASFRYSELAKRPPRRFRFSVKGKLIDRRVGSKVILNRRRAADPSGLLSTVVVRLTSVKHNHQAGMTFAEAVDDVVTVAGYQCVANCQSLCQITGCQEGCQLACQGGSCEASPCQTGCEVSCEDACQGETQCDACEGGVCQTGCEIEEQGCGTCQSCQTSCELGYSCQTICQLGTCQDACQLGALCQTGCQLGSTCQNSCELGTSCQNSCQLGTCQTPCELGTTCETGGCEATCQEPCMNDCQTIKEYCPVEYQY